MSPPETNGAPSPEAQAGFLDRLEVEPLLADCVADLVKSRTDKPLEEMMGYFANVNSLAHVAQREFDFVDACAHNRRAFLLAFERAYGHYPDDEVLREDDLFQLVLLLCPDFPESFVLDAGVLLHPGRDVAFGSLKGVFFVSFFFHAHLRALRQHFNARPSSRAAAASSPEPRLVTLAQVKDASDELTERASATLPVVPDEFLEAAFLDRDGRQSFALPFNSFMAAVVRSRDLVKWLLRPPAPRGWERHTQVPEVAALFRAPDRGGSHSDAHSDRATKSTKSKGQKQRPREKKAKSLAS